VRNALWSRAGYVIVSRKANSVKKIHETGSQLLYVALRIKQRGVWKLLDLFLRTSSQPGRARHSTVYFGSNHCISPSWQHLLPGERSSLFFLSQLCLDDEWQHQNRRLSVFIL